MGDHDDEATRLIVLLFVVTPLFASKTPAYQHGMIAKNPDGNCDVKGTDRAYRIGHCDFQDGQTVDYRANDEKVYIHRDDGKERKYSIQAKISATPEKQPVTYLKGVVLGYETRRDTHVFGGGGTNGSSSPVSTWTRHAKVYELRGVDMIYRVDFCGAFQTGKFTPGQTVDYRVENDRLYILHDVDKEYSCQIEGRRMPDDAKPTENPKP